MPPEVATGDLAQLELQQLREEHALLVELLAIERSALRSFMVVAARALGSVRALLARRAREPEAYLKKLASLRTQYALLTQRAAALPLPTLAAQFAATLQALADPRADELVSGDSLLPALAQIEADFLVLATIAARAGTPLLAPRRRRSLPFTRGTAASAAVTQGEAPRLAVALRQLGDRLAGEFGKRMELSIIGLEQVPDEYFSAVYDMLSQMLRNSIEHGIETPASRTAAGKSASGAVLVEFRRRQGAQAELVFQDDGQGLNAVGILQAATAAGLIGSDARPMRDPRQASTLIFQGGVTTAADAVGRGLGMRIVRENVKRLQGQIQVATKRGQFTRFRIRLPLEAATGAASAQA